MDALPETPIRIRPANRGDVEVLFDIRCSVRENHQSREELAAMGITPDAVAAMLESGDYAAPLALIGSRPVGFAMGNMAEGYVFACFVRPGEEGRGVGRRLLQAVEDAFRCRGVKQAWLSTEAIAHQRSVGFYEHLGWVRTGLMEDGRHWKFTKALDGDPACAEN